MAQMTIDQKLVDRLRAFVSLVRQYDEHKRECTACACGLYCQDAAERWAEIRKRLYALEEDK